MIPENQSTKAARREIKKRPRMQVHGQSLKVSNHHGGKKITKQYGNKK